MSSPLERWWRYPFATAGPLSSALWITVALVGVVSALLLAPRWQFWPGVIAAAGGVLGLRLARHRFMERRDIVQPRIRRPRWMQAVEVAAGIGSVALVVALGWGLGWSWPLCSALAFAGELERRRRWVKLGYTGDPRWARDWSPDADPAHKYRGLSRFLAGHYAEARQLFHEALELEPGDPLTLYNLACSEARVGSADAALLHLNAAASTDERLRKRAQTDEDFASIRDDPRFPR